MYSDANKEAIEREVEEYTREMIVRVRPLRNWETMEYRERAGH